MKNKEQWTPKRNRNESGEIIDNHMQNIISKSYHKAIKKYASGLLGDIGCGDVPYFDLYKDLITDNICIDWENSILEISHLDISTDLNGILPIEDNKFDTILCTDVLEHIHDPALLMSEMTRILKPGGKIIIGVPYYYWIHGIPHDYHRYTQYMLKKFCENNKLKILELETYGGYPEILYDLFYKGYNFYNLPMRRFFNFCLKRLAKFLSKRKFVKNMSERSKETFPLGFTLIAQK